MVTVKRTKTRGYSERVVRVTMGALRWSRRLGFGRLAYGVTTALVAPGVSFIAGYLNRLTVVGRERVPAGGGYLFLSNHQSMLEGHTIAVALLPRRAWFPSKAEFYTTVLRAFLYTLGTGLHAIPVRRGERDMQAVRLMRELLASGESILLFPEGTRSRDGRLGPGKPGVGALVIDTGAPVIPVYVSGFGGGSQASRFGRELLVYFGRPTSLTEGLEDQTPHASRRIVADRAMEAIHALAAEAHGEGLIDELPELRRLPALRSSE
jgi:1-acyl-sn-glycerol-3-phosphate acyltransferase